MPPLKKKHIEKTLHEAMRLHQSGALDEAASLYEAILAADGKDANALLNYSTLLVQRENLTFAETLIKRLIVASPKLPYGHFALGNLLLKAGRPAEAAGAFGRAALLEPGNASYHFNCGVALDMVEKFEEASASYARAIALQPRHTEALVNLANTLHRLCRFGEALELCNRILADQPELALAYTTRGNVLGALQRGEEALADYDRAIALAPGLAVAHNNRGSMLDKRPDAHTEALESYEAAIALNPRYADAHNNRATALNKIGRHHEALESANQALALNPASALAFDTRGNAYNGLGQFDQALADYSRAIELNPQLPTVRWNKALLTLLLGNLAEGLALYEWRWKTEFLRNDHRAFAQPLWQGDRPLEGCTVFVWHEQGFGDFIQMYRYIPLLAAQASQVYLEVQYAMVPLIQPALPANVTLIPPYGVPEQFDYQLPIMSLQLAFKTTLETIPRTFPYLQTTAEKHTKWRARLGSRTRPRIGLVWAGSTVHLNDAKRSIALAEFAPLFDLPFEFHSLQKDVRATDLPLPATLVDHRDAIEDFADTAALIEQLDLVISVDTSVAHLAGALNTPLWVLLPHLPDYRWLLGRSDSPWYPTARLFRQPAPGDWRSVVADLGKALETFGRLPLTGDCNSR